MKQFLLAAAVTALCLARGVAQTPEWIWHTEKAADGEVRYFRKEFTLDVVPAQARLKVTCDNEAIVTLNGTDVGSTNEWKEPLSKPVERFLNKGPNVLAIRGKNVTGDAALIASLDLRNPDGTRQLVVTDGTWQSSETETPGWNTLGFDASAWHKPFVKGKLGMEPWGEVFSGKKKADAPASGVATAAEDLQTLPGFQVELLLSADKERHGSWVSMAKDPQGRLILGAQNGAKITRLTLKDGKVVNDEDLKLPFEEPMGMLWAFDALYINGKGKATDGKSGFGIYRCTDTKGDGQFDKIEQIYAWPEGKGGGEHGSHGLVVGPQNKLYVVTGNFVPHPTDTLPTSPYRNYADDLVLGRAEDGNGFGAGNKPPGGFILRLDPDGKNPEVVASGERNTYDIAFNADGELFGFDSDMEWDWGTPWYRPIRIFHATSGADQGFREGTGKWPEYYPDSLPAVVNIGIGSPTGVLFGTGAKFPAEYQKAFYVLDWTYGRLIAAHLHPNGASYTANWENFVAPKSLHNGTAHKPLDLTAAIVGDDGALYFTVGGRGTQAGFYRVTYVGNESTAPADLHDAAGADARDLRQKLEALHVKEFPQALDAIWPYLGDSDRFIRYAARVAVERQPVAQWRDRALTEKRPLAALNALLALARLGGADVQPAVLEALGRIPFAGLTEDQRLAKVRVIEVSVARHGAPADASKTMAELNAAFPSNSVSLNRELCQTLIALKSPEAVAKTLKLLAAAPTQEEQLTYILALRSVKVGWTPEGRRQYFNWWVHRPVATHPAFAMKWFDDAGRGYADGSSFNGFINNFHDEAEKTLTGQEIDQLQGVLAAYVPQSTKTPRKPAKTRSFVQNWTLPEIDAILGEAGHGRNYDNGRDAFAAAQCVLCHRFGDEGGAVGPDLTSIASRFSLHDIAESIIDPSKVISEQYANEEFTMKNGDIVVGRIVGDTDDKFTVRPSLLAPQMQDVKKADIQSRQLSKTSPMPPALLGTLSKDDVLDLIAYLASAGKKDAPAFQK